MTKIARAAELWARLEKRLINRCGLPNGRMLDVERPGLIRRIGTALSGRAAAVENVSPPLPAKTVTVKLRETWHDNKHIDALADEVAINRRIKKTIDDTINDVKLAAMLEQSCSRRMGYDGDDTVSYERG